MAKKDKRSAWSPPTKTQKTWYKKGAKNLIFKPSVYRPKKGICPKCKTQLSKEGFPSIMNRNKATYLFSKRLAPALEDLYFRCKKCNQIVTYSA